MAKRMLRLRAFALCTVTDAPMTTKLSEPLRREIEVDGAPYTLTITPAVVHVGGKGQEEGLRACMERARQRRCGACHGAQRVVAGEAVRFPCAPTSNPVAQWW